MRYVDPFDNYVVSYRDSGQEEWTVQNIAPMTLDQAVTWKSLLEREGRQIKIQYNGEQ